MKKTKSRFIVSFLLIVFVIQGALADTLTVKGIYQGKNLIAQNALNFQTNTYCGREVWINNVKASVNTNQGAFEIDLSSLKMSDPVIVKIVKNEGCDLKILNASVITSKTGFSFQKVTISENGISWTKQGGSEKGKYFVQREENGGWEIVKEYTGSNNLSTDLSVAHISGNNNYRILYEDPSGKTYYSETIAYSSSLPSVEFKMNEDQKSASLSRDAYYKIIDAAGNELKKGTGKEISLNEMNAGIYYVQTDNKAFKIKIAYNE